MQQPRGIGAWSATWVLANRADRRLFLIGLLAYLLLLVYYFTWQSPACDESSYFDYLIRWAKGRPERLHLLDDSKTPMLFPALGIFLLKPFIPSLSEHNGAGFLLWGRLGMALYVAAMAWFMFCWLLRLLGNKRWFWPWVLFLLDPLVMSNSLLLGSDIASTACWMAGAYTAFRLAATGHRRYAVWGALTLGAGIAVKASMVFMAPMAVMVYATSLWAYKRPHPFSFGKTVTGLLLMGILSLMVLNGAYQYKGFGKALQQHTLHSSTLRQFRVAHPMVAEIPLPLSAPIITGYDLLLRNAESGGGYGERHSYRGVFLQGKYKAYGGFPQYYAVQFFFKTTPLLLLGCLLALVLLWQKNTANRLRRYAPMLIPPLLFVVVLSVTNPFQIGIRHALPAWPFLYIAAAHGFLYLQRATRAIWWVLLLLQTAEIAAVWPNLTAYTPVWMQPKHLLWQRINDSGLQYCSDLFIYRHFLQTHPAYTPPGNEPRAGKYAVRIEDCNPWPGGNNESPCWLGRYFLPAGQYKTTILLYHISPEQIAALQARQ